MPNETNANESEEAENNTDIDEQKSGNTANEEDTSENESNENESDKDKDSDDEQGESEESESNDDEDKDPYEARLQELEDKNKELKKNKTAAIKSEREKRKAAEAKLKEQEGDDETDDDKPLTRKEFDAMWKQKEAEDSIKELTGNSNEQKLIKEYVKQGYSVDDAYLKANEHIIKEHKQAEREQDQEEAVMAGYSRAVPRGKKGSPAWSTDPIRKKAAEGLTPEELKHLDT